MTQYSTAVRNAGVDARVRAIGPSPILRLFAEKKRDRIDDADPGGLLVEMRLPIQWMSPAQNGQATMEGEWTARAVAKGDVASFRFYDAAGSCHVQGSVSDADGEGEMIMDNVKLAKAQTARVEMFAIVSGNA